MLTPSLVRASGLLAMVGCLPSRTPCLIFSPTVLERTPQFHNERLLVGQEGAECLLWTFTTPSSTAARSAPLVSLPSMDAGEVEGERERGTRSARKKPSKASKPKQQSRYPKRTTR